MAELKTKPNDRSVDAFLQAVPDERKRRDSYAIPEMMKRVTGEPPRMWGSSVAGFHSALSIWERPGRGLVCYRLFAAKTEPDPISRLRAGPA